jgi:hypothetical protein
MPVTSDHQDAKTTAELVKWLTRTTELEDRLRTVIGTPTRTSSPAAEDESHPLGHHAAIMAHQAMSSSVEHLAMWRHLLFDAGVQPYGAHMTLLRGSVEGAVTCRWLVDGSATAAERTRRGVALLREDYINRRDFDRDMGIRAVPSPSKTAAVRLKELERECRVAKLKPGATMGVTSRCRAYAVPNGSAGVAVYRLLSAFAHSKQWAALGMKLDDVSSAPAIKGGKVMFVTGNDSLAVSMTTFAVIAAMAGIEDLERHAGMRSA